MNLYSDFKVLDLALKSFSNTNININNNDGHEFSNQYSLNNATTIKVHLETAAKELSLERFAKFENELYSEIFSYINGNNLHEKIGGIICIRELVNCTSASAELKVTKIAKVLSNALNSNTELMLIELIADTLGHMARYSPVSDVDYLEGELNRALGWLQINATHTTSSPNKPSNKSKSSSSTSFRRYAACKVLYQLATNAPTIFFARINDFFDLIWGPLWDTNIQNRYSAGQALSACLAVLKERTYHLQWYCYLYDQFQEGFLNGTEEHVHGSLLVVKEALKYTGDFMIPRFKEVCRSIMLLKDHKSKIVRASIISLLPSLAELCPDAFARAHMDETVEFLLQCCTNKVSIHISPELRTQALIAVGKLCLVVGPYLIPRIDELMTMLKDSLPNVSTGGGNNKINYHRTKSSIQRNDLSSDTCSSIIEASLLCIGDMVQGLGPAFHDKVISLLEPMIQSGLTPELINTLTTISTHMPNQRPLVQIRLLEEVVRVLGGSDNASIGIEPPDYLYSWTKIGSRYPKNLNGKTGLSILQSTSSTGFNRSNSLNSFNKISPIASASTPKPKSTGGGFMSVIQRLGGISRSTSASKSASNTNQLYAGTNIGFTMIGEGLGLGSEQDHPNNENVSTDKHSSLFCSSPAHDLVILSLRTLSTLSIPTTRLIFLLQNSVMIYLVSDDHLVRKEAASTCAKMTATLIKTHSTKGPSSLAIEGITSRLLEVVVADNSSVVRLQLLKSFTSDFDQYLSRAHHIKTLLLLLADERFDNKMEALYILGRIANSNPAVILPSIRQHLITLLSEIKSYPDFRSIEEATLLLCSFLSNSKFHSLVKPFMNTLVNTLPLQCSNANATTAALDAVGKLSLILQRDILPYLDQVLPIIITNMLNPGPAFSRKQEVAVRTLGQFVSSTGYVIKPYLLYPQLLPRALDILVNIVSSKQSSSLRMEILRTLGLLGALEPTKFSMIKTFLQNSEKLKEKKKCSKEIDYKTISAYSSKAESNIQDESVENRDRANSTLLLGSSNYERSPNLADEPPKLQTAVEYQRKHSLVQSSTTNINELLHTDALLADNADEPAHLGMYEQSVMRSLGDPLYTLKDKEQQASRPVPSNEDYYPRIAVGALIKILKDPSLSVHHSTSTQTIIVIFKGLGIRCVPFLEQIVPYFLQIVRTSGPGLRESILQQLSQLVAITGQHIAPYLPSVIEILKDYWSEHLEYVLLIVQQIALTTADTFTSFLNLLLPLLLSSLSVPRELTSTTFKENKSVLKPLEQTLMCHVSLRMSLRSHIHLFVPALCKLITQLQDINHIETIFLQTQTVHTLRCLCSVSGSSIIEQYHVIVSIIVHSLSRTVFKTAQFIPLIPATHEIFSESILTLTVLAHQLGPRILPFDNLILRSLEGSVDKGINTVPYRNISTTIRSGLWQGPGSISFDQSDYRQGFSRNKSNEIRLNGGDNFNLESNIVSSSIFPRTSETIFDIEKQGQDASDARISTGLIPSNVHGSLITNENPHFDTPKLFLNQAQLSRAWDVSQRSTANDWYEWIWRLNIDLLRENPIPTMRACAGLAQAYAPMARELFHAAFVSCWHELSDHYQENLVRALQKAFRSTTIPAEILQSLLNLAEFMEHDVEALPISLSILAELAQKGHAYAKALHYRELEFQTNPAGCFESLININKKLDQYDAASGLLKVVQQIQKKFPALKEVYAVQESWLAKLGHWNEALLKYDEKLDLNPSDHSAIVGKMKCLDALGRWDDAINLCEKHLEDMRVESEIHGDKTLTKAAVIGAKAAWSLNEWHRMDLFVSQLPKDNIDGLFMNAVLAVHSENYEVSKQFIEKTRNQLDHNITTLLAESYSRAYVPFIMVQQCAELEEIVEYKMIVNALSGSVSGESQERYSINEYNKTIATKTSFKIPNVNIVDIGDSEQLSSSSTGKVQLNETTKAEINQRKSHLTDKWRKRIQGCYSSGRAAIPFWKYLLNVRRMILSETEDLDTWLDFVSLCRNGGNRELADRVLMISHAAASRCNFQTQHNSNLQGRFTPSSNNSTGVELNSQELILMDMRIRFAILKQQWAVNDRQSALVGLEALIRNVSQSSDCNLSNNTNNASGSSTMQSYLSCLLKLGEWKIAILDPGRPVDKSTRKEVLSLYGRATSVDPHCYVAWHHWGLSNYRAIEEQRSSDNGLRTTIGGSNIGGSGIRNKHNQNRTNSPVQINDISSLIPLIVSAVKGLMRALTLGTRRYSSSVTQDMLCILSLWFRYGKIPEVNAALEAGLATVHINTWLGVLPQLIARIDHPDISTRNLLHSLLIRLGSKHSQALVFPLFVAIKSSRVKRKEAAETLMNSLRQHSSKLIDQALLVSQELVRVAILWEENWHLSLEEASRLFFGEGNTQGMLDILLPLHATLDDGPNTLREASFLQTHGHDLSDAYSCLKSYLSAVEANGSTIPITGANKKNSQHQRPEDQFLYQAWDFYFAVFKRINAQLPQITALDLQTCSPSLYSSFDLDLGVPGTYTVSGHSIRIKSFSSVVAIIRSKQRPRKLRILGEDGQQYIFLLKGHEDLRQDERAMQLFGLVNALLSYDGRTVSVHNQDFLIQRYAVMPLSPTAGLISWVPNCDTLHDLIRSYRESRKVMLDVEHKLILQVAPSKMYDQLPIMHKVEVFEYALAYTAGEDLSKILWLKSENSESWLQRRTTYTRSLAVMSMVGYILGLGDRHPSNLMLDRNTGKVLHIDFGDCFEVAMQRDKFPEKVPFRLTRMLVNAMEVAGIEGNYRSTCEKVMSVLRENRDSLVATLEAFVHDPLISWRLLNTKKDKSDKVDKPDVSVPADLNNNNNDIGNDSKDEIITESLVVKKLDFKDISMVQKNANNNNTIIDNNIPNQTIPARKPRSLSTTSTTILEPIIEQHELYIDQNNKTIEEDINKTSSIKVENEESNSSTYLSSTPSHLTTILRDAIVNNNNDNTMSDFMSNNQRHTLINLPPPIDVTNNETNYVVQQQLLQQLDLNLSNKMIPATLSTTTTSGTAIVSSSFKSVSFATVNQTLQPDNTVRNSSPRVKIISSTNTITNINTTNQIFPLSNDDLSVAVLKQQQQQQHNGIIHDDLHEKSIDNVINEQYNPYDDAARAINELRTVSNNKINKISSQKIVLNNDHNYLHNNNNHHIVKPSSTSQDIVLSTVTIPTSSFRPNLHLEISSLANSATIVYTSSPNLYGNNHSTEQNIMNETFANSLLQSRQSVSMSKSSIRTFITRSNSISQIKLEGANLLDTQLEFDTSVSIVGDNNNNVTGTTDDLNDLQQELIDKAVIVIRRVMDKLTGLDFNTIDNQITSTNILLPQQQQQQVALQVHEQVDRLIREATSNENLSQCFFGWCPFW